MTRSRILDTSLRLIYHPLLVLSLYLLFAGHSQPGGGFVGGLVAGAAISLRFVAGGIDELRQAVLVRPWVLVGAGLGIAALTAVAPMLFGDAVLESATLEWDVAVLGKVKTTTALPFDTGVFLVVIGLVLMMFEAFGENLTAHDGGAVVAAGDGQGSGDAR